MPRIAHRRYLLAVLTIILSFNYLDRIALGVVFDDIKADLHLSDTQMGFLGGIAFALFYAVMGIPIARWADRGNRVTIISVTAALWSVGVALCSLAGSFLQLLLIRVGVAVGEAGCTPPAFSLIADYFTRAERPRAAAIYGLGGPIACLTGYFLAGWLNELYGWRITFMVLGLPGLALAILAWLTLNEPRDRSPASALSGSAAVPPSVIQPSLKEVCAVLWGNVTFRRVLLCFSIMSLFFTGIMQWQPAFMMRTYLLSSAQVGIWFALTFGVGGALGSYVGGALASRYAPEDEGRQLKTLTMTLMAAGMLACGVYMAPTYRVAFALMGGCVVMITTINGPLFAVMQTLVPQRMRAVAFAVVYMVSNLIGMGLGPLAAGALSDALRPALGEESLRYALLSLTPGFWWAAWYAWRASATVRLDLLEARVSAGI